MKKIIILIVLGIFTLSIHAQVGINTTSPDESAALHIVGDKTKGLLIPFMSQENRNGLLFSGKKTNGLLVYDEDQKMFYFCNGTEWIALNPLHATDGNTDSLKLADGSSTITFENDISITQNLTVSNEVDVTQNITGNKNIIAKDTVKASVIEGYGVTPIGGIIMWSGKTIPDGWVLCDGKQVNGYKTPDLRGRFVVGYGTDAPAISTNVWDNYTNPGNLSLKGTDEGTTGGEMKHVLSIAEMPSHTHSITDPGHTHTLHMKIRGNEDGKDEHTVANDNSNSLNTLRAYTGITINSAGSSTSHENRPPYYVLAFIMRIK